MSSDKQKVTAVLILEAIGRPPEYLTETLEKLIVEIGKEPGVKVKRSKVNESVLIKDQKNYYTNFAEIEVEVDEILRIAVLMFKYMPAHIEILSPQTITLRNSDWDDILNEIARKLHGYEEITRIVQTEKLILEKKLHALTGKDKKE
jgi:hypothetical protein